MFSTTLKDEIYKHESDIERLRTLPDHILELAYEEKLFKLFVPVELGGKMLSLPEAVQVFEKASELDGSFGWLVTIGSGGNMFVPNFEEQQCEKLFSPADAVIAGSGQPNGIATKNAGGFIVSGKWSYCSGANYASMYTANAMIENTGEVVSCIFMKDQVSIIDDWGAFGLKGTGSNTIEVVDAFVPIERTFRLDNMQNHFGGLVHTFPFVQFSQSSFAAVCVGIGKRFFQEATELLEQNKVRWSNGLMEKYNKIDAELMIAIEKFEKDTESFHEKLAQVWRQHELGEKELEKELHELSVVCQEVATTAIASSSELIRKFGMVGVMEESRLNRTWRNLYTAGQHVFLAN